MQRGQISVRKTQRDGWMGEREAIKTEEYYNTDILFHL